MKQEARSVSSLTSRSHINDQGELRSELQTIVNSRTPMMLRNYPLVRTAYQTHYDFPELDPLRYEISICITFGLHQAAIALTNHLLESMLKYALIYQHSLKKKIEKNQVHGRAAEAMVESWAEGKKLYGDKNLDFNINQACRTGLITKDQKKMLHEYREVFRNAYGHADKEKTFGDAQAPITSLRFEQNAIVKDSEADVRLADLLMFQGLIQATQAESRAVPYFLSIDDLTRQVIRKLFPNAATEPKSPDCAH